MPIISDLSAVFVVVAMAAHAGHSLAALFCFPGNYSTCSNAVQVLSACVCVRVCVVCLCSLNRLCNIVSANKFCTSSPPTDQCESVTPSTPILRHFLLFFMRNEVLRVHWSMWIGRITPPCLSLGFGGACSGPRRSCVYSWILLMGSVGTSGTSPRMSLRRIGPRWPSAGSARCTRSRSKPGGRNVSWNAFTQRCVPKAPTGRFAVY